MRNQYRYNAKLWKKYLSMPMKDIKTGEDVFFWGFYNCNGGRCDQFHVYYQGEHYYIFDEECIMRLGEDNSVENGEILFETDEPDLDSIMAARCFPGNKNLQELLQELDAKDVYGC